MPNYVPGIGPLEPKLMIVGEAPGTKENEQQRRTFSFIFVHN